MDDALRSEHRVVIESIWGRQLEPHETVHHINEDPRFNHPDNLFVCVEEEHMYAHKE